MTCLTLSFVAVLGLLGNIPAYPGELGVQAAQANHNTARSNKNTVAAPDAPQTGDLDADAAPANHNTARSNKNNIAGPGTGTGTGKPSVSYHTNDEPKAQTPNAAAPR